MIQRVIHSIFRQQKTPYNQRLSTWVSGTKLCRRDQSEYLLIALAVHTKLPRSGVTSRKDHSTPVLLSYNGFQEKNCMINRTCLLTIAFLPSLLTGCATYESQPGYATTVTGSYGPAPYYYPPRTVYYVEPAPVYVAPSPVYVTPAPAFGAQIYSSPHQHRTQRNRDRRGRTSHPHDERTGNAAGSQLGGPGWGGTVWKR